METGGNSIKYLDRIRYFDILLQLSWLWCPQQKWLSILDLHPQGMGQRVLKDLIGLSLNFWISINQNVGTYSPFFKIIVAKVHSGSFGMWSWLTYFLVGCRTNENHGMGEWLISGWCVKYSLKCSEVRTFTLAWRLELLIYNPLISVWSQDFEFCLYKAHIKGN